MLPIQILEKSVTTKLRRFVLIKERVYAHTTLIVQMANCPNLCVEKVLAVTFGRQLVIWKMIGFKSQTHGFARNIPFCPDFQLGEPKEDVARMTRCYVVRWILTLQVS